MGLEPPQMSQRQVVILNLQEGVGQTPAATSMGLLLTMAPLYKQLDLEQYQSQGPVEIALEITTVAFIWMVL